MAAGDEPDKLINQAIDLIKTYNPAIATVDAFVGEKLGKFGEDDVEKVFIQQVFYGCMRYKKVLKVFLSTFYFNNSGNTSRNDYNLYMVLAYITLFRLGEMSFKRYKAVLASQDVTKMHVFLSYLFSISNVEKWMKEEWCKYLDRTFVEDALIGGIRAKMDEVQAWLAEHQEAAFGAVGAAAADAEPEVNEDEEGATSRTSKTHRSKYGAVKSSKEPTIPVAPDLTIPRPRLIPEPIAIQQTAVSRPIPASLHKTSLEKVVSHGSERKEQIRKTTAAKYSKDLEFKLHKTRTTGDKVREEVEAERMKELNAKFIPKPMPKYPTRGADVRLNVAAVLREDALFRKKQAKEAELIKNYESELRDSTEYYAWRKREEERDDQAKKEAVEARRIEMVASQKEAQEASIRRKLENKAVASAMREVGKTMKEIKEAEEESLLNDKKALAEEVREVRTRAPREAEARVLEANIKRRDAIKAEEESRRIAKEKADAEEQARKDDLIRQIRALERVPKVRVKVFDPTESAGYGLLDELSLVELKERLEMNKARVAEAEQLKRQDIMRQKREKEDSMRARVESLARVRAAASSQNRQARARRKKAEADKAATDAAIRDKGNMALAERLAKKRAEREAEERRLAEETARIAKQRMFLGAAKNAIEERHFDEQLKAQERGAELKQRSAKRAQVINDHTKSKDDAGRKAYLRRERAAKRAADAEAAEKLRVAKADGGKRALAETARKKEQYFKATIRQEKLLEARDASNVYAARQTMRTLDATRTRSGRTIRADMTATHRQARNARMGVSEGPVSSEVMAWKG